MYNDDPKQLKIPEVGEYLRGTGTLIKIEKIQRSPESFVEYEYIFERITATGEMRRKGKTIQTFSTFWDHYGLNTSVEQCIDDMKHFAEDEDINKNSEVELVVIKTTTHRRFVPVPRYNFYSPQHISFDTIVIGYRANLPPEKSEIVWSSRKDL